MKVNKWTILKILYRAHQRSPDGFVHMKELKERHPDMMHLLEHKLHGHCMYDLTKATATMPAYMQLVDHKGTYRLTIDGIKKGKELMEDDQ